MTWSRRKRSPSAWGSSRVLIIGRPETVVPDTSFVMCSARWLRQYRAPPGPCWIAPAPGEDLPGDEKGNQALHQAGKRRGARTR